MEIARPLRTGILLRRYKRFLVAIDCGKDGIMTVHCPNSGSMKGCAIPGATAWISDSENPKRKLRYTLEIIETDDFKICVNTQRPNGLVEEAIRSGVISELDGYEEIKREVRYGSENSRIDLLLTRESERCFVEVKNATLGDETGVIRFPDAVTTRGTKHLRELMDVVRAGERAVLIFCVSRTDGRVCTTADEIDPEYGQTLRLALSVGVEVLAYALTIEPPTLRIAQSIPFQLPDELHSDGM